LEIAALIPAAGAGKRMHSTKNKLLLLIEDRPIIIRTLEIFNRNPHISQIIVATGRDEREIFEDLVRACRLEKVAHIIAGGAERQDSVYNMLQAAHSPDMVAVHDGARPLLDDYDLERTLEIPEGFQGVVLGVPLKDTIKKVDTDHVVLDTPRREEFWMAQTPQVFHYHALLDAHARARDSHLITTDDASLVEHCGGRIKMVAAQSENIKITTGEDIFIAEAILRKRRKF
jgi:2-C-methyl-D-erythritol 4-phosphate cytidylyltransferase